MKKSILSSKILLVSGLLLFTIECKCPANEKRQLRQAESTIEDMEALLEKIPTLSESIEQVGANDQKIKNLIKELHTIEISKVVEYIADQQINELDQAERYYNDIEREHKDIKRKEKKEILPYINKSAELLINTIEAIKKLFYSESEEVIRELPKVLNEFLETYKECEKEGKTFVPEIDNKLKELIKDCIEKLEMLENLNYQYVISLINNLNESFNIKDTNKPKPKIINKSPLAIVAYIGVLVGGCIHNYLYMTTKEINQKNQHGNNALSRKGY